MNDVIRIEAADDDRFDRFRLISWWDQQKLAKARILVIGAGALGNELLKNLALLGVGNVLVADLDTIEQSNLSRSVLYRAGDRGRQKSDVAAERAREIYPEMRTHGFNGNVVYDLGLGVYRWSDLILGGLDNREARVAINQSASRVGRIWIDGAIERLEGVARLFNPADGPCYECTMSDIDWKMLEARRSCALLTRDEMEQGKVPTTPTTSSVIAGIQAQEAVKWLHGLPTLSGQGYVFDGRDHNSYVVTYSRLEDCPSHEKYEPLVELPLASASTRVRDLLEHARSRIGEKAVIEFNQDLLRSLRCERCQTSEEILASLGKVTEAQGRCPQCNDARIPEMYHTVDESSDLLDHTLAELGVPLWDIIGARAGMQQIYFEMAGDRELILGPLA
ncbi:MAG: ThiF family adenylyltransferase [Planctomycetaceae bacterium]